MSLKRRPPSLISKSKKAMMELFSNRLATMIKWKQNELRKIGFVNVLSTL